MLLRGTADDDVPCPGYLFEEIASILLGNAGSREGSGGRLRALGWPRKGLWVWAGAGAGAGSGVGEAGGSKVLRPDLFPMGREGSLTPTPEISHESPGSSQCLLEYLLNRLQSNSCHVKLKVGEWW